MATMGKARSVLGLVISTILLDDAPREAELGRGRLRKVPSTLMDACRDPRDPTRSRRVVNRALMAAMRRPSKIRRAHADYTTSVAKTSADHLAERSIGSLGQQETNG